MIVCDSLCMHNKYKHLLFFSQNKSYILENHRSKETRLLFSNIIDVLTRI